MASFTTYAAVDRRCEVMRKQGVREGEIALFRYDEREKVRARRKRRFNNAATVRVPRVEELDELLKAISDKFGAVHLIVRARSRKRTIEERVAREARQAFVWAARNHKTSWSLNELASYLRRPAAHSSIIYMTQQATLKQIAIAKEVLEELNVAPTVYNYDKETEGANDEQGT